MLVKLERRHISCLSRELERLSKQDKQFFNPHDYDVATLESLLRDSSKHYYIYCDDIDNIAGYGMIRAWEGYNSPTIGCVIWPKYRRCGNGAKLVKELIERARQLGYESVKLKVSRRNRTAYRLYKKVGFTETGEITHDKQIWMVTNCGRCNTR